MQNNSSNWHLYSCCFPVKGSRRSIIYDIQRDKYFLIPNSLYELLADRKGMDFEKLSNTNVLEKSTIEEYAKFLQENELIFETNDPGLFPPISLEWKSPFWVTNAIIDLGNDLSFLKSSIHQLIGLRCQHLQLRFFKPVCYEILDTNLSFLESSEVKSVELFVKYNHTLDVENLKPLIQKHKRIFSITVYDSPEDILFNRDFYMGKITFISENLVSSLCCGVVHPTLFNINIPTYTESQHHNSCLNRKISLDTEGNIKNCPSMPQSFGNIKDTTLQDALEHPDFKKYWNVTKDQIEVCKDCEFRYICTDCRAYTENPRDMYAKPLKCGYNPYTCVWEEWSTNPLKQKAIDYYGMREVLPEFKMKPDYVPARTPKPEPVTA